MQRQATARVSRAFIPKADDRHAVPSTLLPQDPMTPPPTVQTAPHPVPLKLGRGRLAMLRRRRRRRDQPHLRALESLCECPSCGYFQRMPELEPGQVASCRRCRAQLGRRRTNPPVSTPLAFCVASAILYLVAITQPLLTFDLYGRSRAVTLMTGPIELVAEGRGLVGILVFIATVLMPPIVIGLMMAVLYAANLPRLPRWAPRLMRRYEQLRPWSMIEVYILGVFVAYTKLIDLAHVEIGPGVYALAVLMLTMAATDSTLDIDLIWQRRPVSRVTRRTDGTLVMVCAGETDEIEIPPPRFLVACSSCGLVCETVTEVPAEQALGHCPRCRNMVRKRKPQSLLRCSLLLFSAVILYIPANLFPIMDVIKLSRGGGHTILNGVRELYEAGMLPLALLVFFASITVPVLKILGLAVMLLCTWKGWDTRIVDRSRLFRIIDFIGRWSMIDVFMVSILVAIVRFAGLASITAEAGVTCFASVVVLTIFAANCFDPRVMWDAAGLNGMRMCRKVNKTRTDRAALRPAAARSMVGPAGESAGA